MKTTLFLFLLSLTAITAVGQTHSDSSANVPNRIYVGVELNSINYSIGNASKQVVGGFMPMVHTHVGYRLTKRMNVQVGFAYGRDKEDGVSGVYYGKNDTIIYYHRSLNTRGIAVPMTVQFTPFSLYKKLQLYATASFIPVFGSVWKQEAEEFRAVKTVTSEQEDSGVYSIVTLGLQLNYKLNKRLDIYGQANFYYNNLGEYSKYVNRTKSVALGLNYSFYRSTKRGITAD